MLKLQNCKKFIFVNVISIVKNSVNTVVVTLEEKRTLTVGKYLFEFIHDQTKTKCYCVGVNLSSYTGRYDKFAITDTASPIALSGQVNLKKGFGKYNIYEQTSSTNLDPTGLSVVESGKYLVTDTLATDYTHSVTTTEYVYE
jgi:hypothetical protein